MAEPEAECDDRRDKEGGRPGARDRAAQIEREIAAERVQSAHLQEPDTGRPLKRAVHGPPRAGRAARNLASAIGCGDDLAHRLHRPVDVHQSASEDRIDAHRDLIPDWIEAEPDLTLAEVAARLDEAAGYRPLPSIV